MRAAEAVNACLRETGARDMSKYSKEIALIGLMHASLANNKKAFRRRIRQTFIDRNPNCGSFFLVFILPLLISIISNWIVRWIFNRKDLPAIATQAFDALTAQSQSTTGTPTSISTPQTKPTEPRG